MKHKAHCKHAMYSVWMYGDFVRKTKEPWCELTHEECAVSRKRCPMYERAKEKNK